VIYMPQDITPNNQSASTTNTMNPRTLSAQSAGSITPTIISQNNQDRRRRAAAREARRQENLAANVERAEIQKEYENLRRVEEAANRRAEERKAAANREKVTFYAGGVNTPLEVKRVSIGQYLGDQLKGASEPIAVSEELRQFATMGNPGESGNVDAAYLGLDKFRESVNGLLKREAEEKTLINRVREFATLTGSSVSQATYTPLTPEAREAHERLISDPNTSSEMKAQLSADLVRDSEYVKTHGINGNLSASEEKRLSEIYTGGSSVSKDLKDAAAAYLSAAGSTYGKEEFNRAQSGIYVNQTEKARDALLQRYQARDEINNPDNTAATTAALRANQAAAGDVLNDLTESRNRLGLENVEKRELSNAVESQYSKQDARIRELLRDNPNVREDENSSRMVESILKVSDGGMVDLSSDAFFREQAATERRFGSEWASAGGKTAAEAAEDGERSTSYSRFKSAADEATEYLLIDAEGKQRYTLKQGADGGFSIFGWTGDLVASGQSAQGLPGALRNLNIPFDEKSFNVFRPDSDSTLVELKDETDITGIDTAATFKASILGTLRTNEDILNADAERRSPMESAKSEEVFDAFMGADAGSAGMIGKSSGLPILELGMSARNALNLETKNLEGVTKYTERDHNQVDFPIIENTPKLTTIYDEFVAEGDLDERARRIEALTYGVRNAEGKSVGGLYGTAQEYSDLVEELVESGELVGDKEKILLLEDEDPDKSIFTYTNLVWTADAKEASIEKYLEAEKKLNEASKTLSEEVAGYNAKVAEKEQLSKGVYFGIPQAITDLSKTYLPEAKDVYPFYNVAEIINPMIGSTRQLSDSIHETISGESRSHLTTDYWKEQVFDRRPVVANYFDYELFRESPVNYAAVMGAGSLLPIGAGAVAVGVKKAAPYVRLTVTDPLKNTALVQKSSKYVSDILKNIPEGNLPIGIRVGKTKVRDGYATSLMLVTRRGQVETAHPLISRVGDFHNDIFGRRVDYRYFVGSNYPLGIEGTLPFTKSSKLINNPLDVTIARSVAMNPQSEGIDSDLMSPLRLDLAREILYDIHKADPIVVSEVTPHITDVVRSKPFKNPEKVSKAIIDTMSEEKVVLQGSFVQYATGRESKSVGLNRPVGDFDIFAGDPYTFAEKLVKRVNEIEGEEVLFLNEFGKIYIKSDMSELIDVHGFTDLKRLGEGTGYTALGVRENYLYRPSDADIVMPPLQTQVGKKLSGLLELTESKEYEDSIIFGPGGPGANKVIMPSRAEREKDLPDLAYALFNIEGRMLSSENPAVRKMGRKLSRDIDNFLETYGVRDELRTEYAANIKTNPVYNPTTATKAFKISSLNKYVDQGIDAIDAAENQYQNPKVQDFLNWTKRNVNADTIVGVPLGAFMTASFIDSAAERIVTGEATPQEIVSRELVPMLMGAYIGGRALDKLNVWRAFANRSNYIPLSKLTSWEVYSGREKFPIRDYLGTEADTRKFVNAFGRGGEGMSRAESVGIESDNAKFWAFRAESRTPDEVVPNVSEIWATKYIDEDKSVYFSGSAGYQASPHFTRVFSGDIFAGKGEEYNIFSLNAIPSIRGTPHMTVMLGTKPIGYVPLGMGTPKTLRYIEKNIDADQYAAVSGKTALFTPLTAEIEGTIRPGARYEVLDRSLKTSWYGKDIAVDVVGMIRKGQKSTDVNYTFNPKKGSDISSRLTKDEFDKMIEEYNNAVFDYDHYDIGFGIFDLPMVKQKIKYYKEIYGAKPGKKQTAEDKQRVLRLSELESKLDKFARPVRYEISPEDLTERAYGGNPFAASALPKSNPFTAQTQKEKSVSTKQISRAERTEPGIFKSSSPGIFTESRSAQSMKRSSSSSDILSNLRSALSTETTSGAKSSRSSSKTSTSSVSSYFSRSSGTSSSMMRSSGRRSSTKSTASRSSPFSSGKADFSAIKQQRKSPKLKLKNKRDRLRDQDLNIFTVENVDLPILRGEEALTGKTLPKFELPTNRKTLYQFGNMFTSKKPKLTKKNHKNGFNF